MTAATILKLIEGCEPDDTAKMDEIDARVWCYVREHTYREIPPHPDSQNFIYIPKGNPVPKNPKSGWCGTVGIEFGRYTRSRDALKAIRPKGWEFQQQSFGCKVWSCYLTKKSHDYPFDVIKHIQSALDAHQTEELAELHAIIQALEHTRTTKGTPE